MNRGINMFALIFIVSFEVTSIMLYAYKFAQSDISAETNLSLD